MLCFPPFSEGCLVRSQPLNLTHTLLPLLPQDIQLLKPLVSRIFELVGFLL